MAAGMARQPIRAITIDALGTLLELVPPAPRLRAGLRERLGVEVSRRGGGAGDEGRDRATTARICGWAATRPGSRRCAARCAEVLRDALGRPRARPRRADRDAAGRDPLRAVPRRGAGAAGAAGGAGSSSWRRSNWDVSLHEQLDRTGLTPLLDGALSSAEVGAPKPDPEIFARALALAGARPEEALHVGDDVEADVGGALAAGLEPVLIDRDGTLDGAAGRAPDRLAGRAAGALCVEWICSDDERPATRTLSVPRWDQPRASGRRSRPSRRASPRSRRGRRWPRWSSAFVVATIAYLLIAAGVEAGGGNVTTGGPPGLVISATLVQDVALIAAARAVRVGIWARGAHAGDVRAAAGRARPGGRLDAAGLGRVLRPDRDLHQGASASPTSRSSRATSREEESLAALVGYGVLLAFVAPLAEEFFFRGFVFGVLREKIGVAGGALATGVVFGLVHVAGSPIETVGVLVILGVAAVRAVPARRARCCPASRCTRSTTRSRSR